MIDLSNNNGIGHDFRKAYASGQRRLYVKITEGINFVDLEAHINATQAKNAGFKVGGYHFAHPENDPVAEATFFCKHLQPGYRLRPCLDIETGTPSVKMRNWIAAFLTHVFQETKVRPIIYSYSPYLQACGFLVAPAELWLAAYGKDDGKEYPVNIPHPWTHIAAHQFTSRAKVLGIKGTVDLSHVLDFTAIDKP